MQEGSLCAAHGQEAGIRGRKSKRSKHGFLLLDQRKLSWSIIPVEDTFRKPGWQGPGILALSRESNSRATWREFSHDFYPDCLQGSFYCFVGRLRGLYCLGDFLRTQNLNHGQHTTPRRLETVHRYRYCSPSYRLSPYISIRTNPKRVLHRAFLVPNETHH
jgi:hypothetical protein